MSVHYFTATARQVEQGDEVFDPKTGKYRPVAGVQTVQGYTEISFADANERRFIFPLNKVSIRRRS